MLQYSGFKPKKYKNTKTYVYLKNKIHIYSYTTIIKMAGRPKGDNGDSVSFAIYLKTRILLDELRHGYLKHGENKALKEIAHDAIEEYYNKNK